MPLQLLRNIAYFYTGYKTFKSYQAACLMVKRKLLCCTLLLLSINYLKSQEGLRWWRCVGGTAYDQHIGMTMSRSGLIISVGRTESNDGDISGNHGGGDALISAVRKNGTLAWTKAVGGTNAEGINGGDVDTLTDGN